MAPLGPAAVVLAVLCLGQLTASTAAHEQQSSTTCGWRSAHAAAQQQCPLQLWYSIPRCPAQAGEGTTAASVLQPADVKVTQSRSIAAHKQCAAGFDSSRDTQIDRQVYIVRFTQYRMLADLKQLLLEHLSTAQQHWAWVDRDNRAVQLHPTDFALLSVDVSQLPQLLQLLQQLPGFRDVHPDRRIRGSRNWQPEGPLAAALSNAPVTEQQQQQQNMHPALRQAPSSLKMMQELAEPQQGSQQHPSVFAGLHTMPTKQLLADAPDSSNPQQPSSSQQGVQQQQQQPQPPAEQQTVKPPTTADAEDADSDSIWSVSKPPGRMSTSHTIGLDPKSKADRDAGYNKDELRRRRRGLLSWASGWWGRSDSGSGQEQQQSRLGRLLRQSDSRVTHLLEAPVLWKQGFSGKGIKVGVFDTGIREGHPHIRFIRERTNWTHQNSLSDGLGHGSFVAGVIGSQDQTCPGFAPDMELYTFKVFTDDQVSYTSWFLDAFNHAIATGLTIINLSIGGPDFLDQPFVDKVLEVTSNGLIMISAIGNDGPLYGTLNNPADQPDVIGVGGIDNNDKIAQFSSRGMTTWELPTGTGRIKPDVMAYGKDVSGSKITTGCRSLSGTSVASPVVAGAATLLASTLPDNKRWLLNPGSLKQALVEGAVRLPDLNMYEQGNGRINLPNSQKILAAYEPRASVIPPAIDFTDCPYMWPYCTQPLYAFGLPVAFNATIVNGMAVTAQLAAPPVFKATDEGGRLLHVTFKYSEVIWPWSGYLAIFVEVSPGGWNYTGVASGNITFHVQSPPQYGTKSVQISIVTLPLKVNIIPTPPREKRVLWDVLHSIKYPPGYVPRDNLDIKSDVLDWHGDHPFTNFHDTLNSLREAGYFVEILHSPSACFSPDNYGAYLVMDSEEEWYPKEVEALSKAVKEHGMALVVFAEWYHLQSLRQMKFFDDNTRSWWTPITGGANVPALNDLLAPHNITLGERILQGVVTLGDHKVTVSYGANIAKFPAGGYLHVTNMNDASGKNNPTPGDWAAFGVTASGKGQVAVLGDTNCLDSSHMVSPCHDFLKELLDTVLTKKQSGLVAADKQLKEPYTAPGYTEPPQRRTDINFTRYSWVLQHNLTCYPTAPCQYRTPSDCPKEDKSWEHKALIAGQEPANSLQALKEAQDKAAAATAAAQAADEAASKAAAEKSAAAAAAAAREAEAQKAAAAAAANAAAANDASREVKTDATPGAAAAQQPWAMDMKDSTSVQAEAAQQRQWTAIIAQAASWGTIICIAGLLGLVVLWQMRSAAGNGSVMGRRWGRYAPVQRRPPSPPPADRMV